MHDICVDCMRSHCTENWAMQWRTAREFSCMMTLKCTSQVQVRWPSSNQIREIRVFVLKSQNSEKSVISKLWEICCCLIPSQNENRWKWYRGRESITASQRERECLHRNGLTRHCLPTYEYDDSTRRVTTAPCTVLTNSIGHGHSCSALLLTEF